MIQFPPGFDVQAFFGVFIIFAGPWIICEIFLVSYQLLSRYLRSIR